MTEQIDAGPDAGVGTDGVGEVLSRARTALGLTIGDVALQLKFAPRQIAALEQERFEQLPPGMFSRGMLRAYARLLKLDPEPLVQRIADRVAVPDNTNAVAAVRRPIPITDTARRGNLVYAGLSLAVLGVIAAVLFEWQRERASGARMDFVPAAQAPLQPTQAPLQPTQAPLQPTQAPLPPKQQVASLQTVAPPADAAPLTEAAPAQAALPGSARPAAGKRHIRLKFERESWVEIKDGGGKTLMSQLNPAGSEQAIEGRPPFDVIIGNAQHVRFSYDDRSVDLAPHVKVEVARFTLE
jgi:cytoskeleton protein RodZ